MATSDDHSLDDYSFDIPDRPERRFPPSGGVEYEGKTVFYLTPAEDRSTGALDGHLTTVLSDERYVRGDFFDLPAPAYLVRDSDVGSSFRAVVRDGHVELHVLPHTDEVALEALFEALVATSGVEWDVECHCEPAPSR